VRVVSIVGTRPNFMKIAPIAAELARRGKRFEHVLVHTGQHYDDEMSDVFVDELGLETPRYNLGIGSATRALQLARTIERLEPVLADVDPEVVLVPGDVNSTLGAALAAESCGIPVGHVEAGLRSFDRTMPEEINRILVDAVAELLFTHSAEAEENLAAERCSGVVHFVGNTMVDTLVAMGPRIDAADTPGALGFRRGEYLVVTLHRPVLVDRPLLRETIARLDRLAVQMPVVFPAHPRTRRAIEAAGIRVERVELTAALGYVEFLSLVANSAGVLTDSGGVQEETTYLGVPCFTLRDATERPVTVELGTNVLLGLDPRRIDEVPARLADALGRTAGVPPLWDGRAARRIVDVLERAPLRADQRLVAPERMS
jgi:UDP-N-acetylglucosamine 2-epimerase (non-hydrolysing)